MDYSAIEKARLKAEAVRATLQRKQQIVVDSRLAAGQQQEEQKDHANLATAPTLSPTSGADKVVHTKSRSFDDNSPPPPATMEDFTSAHDDEDDSHDGETTNYDRSDVMVPEISPPVLPLDSMVSERAVSEKIKSDLLVKGGDDTSASSPAADKWKKGDSCLVGASVTQQVLSSSAGTSGGGGGPRYLRYRDSLLRSSIKSARSSSVATSDNESIESQLKSYFDRSLPRPARGDAVPPPNQAATLDSNRSGCDDMDLPGSFEVAVDIEEGGATRRMESADSSLSSPANADSTPSSPPIVALQSSSPESASGGGKAQGRTVFFDPSNDQVKSPRSFEEPSESEGSYPSGTLTRKEYRRRRMMQIGVLVFVFVCSPLAIGLGVVYSNRPPAPSSSLKDQGESTGSPGTSSPHAAPVTSPTSMESTDSPSTALPPTQSPTSAIQISRAPTTTPTAPLTTIVPTTVSSTSPPRVISFPPVTSILDLLLVSENSTQGDL